MPQLTNTLAGSVVRDLLDTALVDAVTAAVNGTCAAAPEPRPPAPPPSSPLAPGVVDWRTSGLLHTANWLANISGLSNPAKVNAVLDELLVATHLGANGSLQIDLSSVLSPLLRLPANATLVLGGLDTFTAFSPIAVPSSKITSDPTALVTHLAVETLAVDLHLSIDPPWQLASPSPVPIMLSVHARTTNASLAARGRLALNGTGLLALPLISLPELACLALQVLDIAVDDLAVSAGEMHVAVTGNDWGSPSGIEVAILDPPMRHAAIPSALASLAATSLANFAIRAVRAAGTCNTSSVAPVPPPGSPPPPPSYVDWSHVAILQQLHHALANLTDAKLDATIAAAVRALDHVIDLVTHSTRTWPLGTLPLIPLSFRFHDHMLGDIAVALESGNLSGTNSLYGLRLLDTFREAPQLLESGIGLGNDTLPLALAATVRLRLAGVWHAFDVRVALQDLLVSLGSVLRVDLNQLRALSLGDLVAVESLCFLRPIDSLTLDPSSTTLALDVRDASPLVSFGLRAHPDATEVGGSVNFSVLEALRFPVGMANVTATLVQILNDKALSSLLDSPHHSCDVHRGTIVDPPPPMAAPPPPPPTQPFFVGVEVFFALVAFVVLFTGATWGYVFWQRRSSPDTDGMLRDTALSDADCASVGLLPSLDVAPFPMAQQREASRHARHVSDGSATVVGTEGSSSEGDGGSPRPDGADGLADEDGASRDPVGAEAGSSNGAQSSVPMATLSEVHPSSLQSAASHASVGCAGGSVPSTAAVEARQPTVSDPSLAQHSNGKVRYAFTLCLFLNGCLFFYANTHPGATVHVLLHMSGRRVDMPPMYTFGLLNSVEEMWQSSSYPLAVVIAAMSGVWPYVKLLVMGILWWLSPSMLSAERRGLILRILDATGKWCLVDTQMLGILMVALHFTIVVPSQTAAAPPLVHAQVETTPEIGVDTFVAATLISLVLTHLELHYHRRAITRHEERRHGDGARKLVRAGVQALGSMGGPGGHGLPVDATANVGTAASPMALAGADAGGSPEGAIRACSESGNSLGQRKLARLAPVIPPRICVCQWPYRARGLFLRLRNRGEARHLPRWLRCAVPVALATALAVLAMAMNVTAFTLHVRGIVGTLLGPGAVTDFSLLQLATELGSVSVMAPQFIVRGLQMLFIATCIALPLVWVVLVFFLWCLPLRKHALRSFLVGVETVYAWSMLDVLVIIVATSLLELNQVAKFSLGDECDGINALLVEYPSLGDRLPGEPSCFGVVPTLDRGYFALAMAIMLANLVGGFVMCAARAALDEHDSWPKTAALMQFDEIGVSY